MVAVRLCASARDEIPNIHRVATAMIRMLTATGNPTVLAVAPRSDVAATWAGGLSSAGYQGEIAAVGQEAIDIARLQADIELVLVDMAIEGISSVSTDWLSGMDGAVAHLKGRGHRKVWMVAYPLPLPLVDPKTIAFCESCERHRMEWHIVNGGSDLRTVRQMGRALAEEADRPTAVIAYSDYAATGLISGIRDGGLEVPRDIAVVGIDGTEAGAYYHPALTTIGAGIERLAGEAVDLLFKLVSSDRGASPRSLSLASSLTIRSSA